MTTICSGPTIAPDMNARNHNAATDANMNMKTIMKNPKMIRKPIRLQIFISGSVLDAFIDERTSITTRTYELREGALALEFRDSGGEFRNLSIRRLTP